jgi:multisubunit Na+/H+ antiporter MnhB subunit
VPPGLIFDLTLAAIVCLAALCAVLGRDLVGRIAFFIIYGLLLSIVWVRLDAIDVAMTEAAIGAGLTGMLFIAAAARIRHAPGAARRRGWREMAVRGGHGFLALTMAATLGTVVLGLPAAPVGLSPLAEANLATSGVSHPVTAVLLNYRGYDTLLETIVLVAALVGVWSLTGDRAWGGRPGAPQHALMFGVLDRLARLLVPAGALMAIYVLWRGATAPGGAFQAAAILAAVWLLAAMARLTQPPHVSSFSLRLLLVAGPALFLTVAALSALKGVFLAYSPETAHVLIVTIEGALAISIAAILALLVRGAPMAK